MMDHPSGLVLNLILNGVANSGNNVLMDAEEKHAGYTHMSMAVTNLDPVLAELERLGIPITEGPIEYSGTRMIFIRDPDESVVELNQSTGEAPA